MSAARNRSPPPLCRHAVFGQTSSLNNLLPPVQSAQNDEAVMTTADSTAAPQPLHVTQRRTPAVAQMPRSRGGTTTHMSTPVRRRLELSADAITSTAADVEAAARRPMNICFSSVARTRPWYVCAWARRKAVFGLLPTPDKCPLDNSGVDARCCLEGTGDSVDKSRSAENR